VQVTESKRIIPVSVETSTSTSALSITSIHSATKSDEIDSSINAMKLEEGGNPTVLRNKMSRFVIT
jgi:hypothetical protein